VKAFSVWHFDAVYHIASLNFSTQYIGWNKLIDLAVQESGENSGKKLQI